jgi:Big-like domain-containing protein
MHRTVGEVTGGTSGLVGNRNALGALLLGAALVACGKGSSGAQIGLTSIAVTPGTAVISAGTKQQFAAVGTYSDGSTAPITAGIRWSSSSPSVAAIDASGLATGVAGTTGTATITASVGAVSGRSSLTVTRAALQSVTVSPGTASLAAGLDQQFTATGTFADGTSGPLASGIVWSTSAAAVATVDAVTGLVHGVASGTGVTITATHAPSGLSGSASIDVTGAVLQSITLAPAAVSLPKGVDQQFIATGHFSDGTSVALAGLSWTSSSNLTATVDTVGLASAIAPGPTPAVITATDLASGVSGSASLSVTDAAIQVVALSPPVASVPAGYGRQFTVTGFYTDGSNHVLPAAELTFVSSNPAVAALDGTVGGMAYGVSVGTATITATHVPSGLSAMSQLTITVPPSLTAEVPANQLPFSGVITAGGVARYKIVGLLAGTEYLVRFASPEPDLLVQVHAFGSFDSPVCTAYAGPVPCRGAIASPVGEMFVLASGAPGSTFTFEITPTPVLHANVPALASVDRTETYYRVEGLTAGSLFHASLGGLTDDADLFVYDGPHGPFGSGTLCSSIVGGSGSEACQATVPGSGVVYVTVEGWLTSAGTPFALAVTP